MKHNTKLVVVFSLIFFLLCSSVGFAAPSLEKTNDNVNVTNEYLLIKELQRKSTAELLEFGYNSNNIDELRKIDYAAILKERSKLDDNLLRNMGYTKEQIEILRNFEGTEEEIIALSASLFFDARRTKWEYVNGTQYFDVWFNWEWSTVPATLNTDIIGAGWSESMYLTTSTTQSYHTVTYRNFRNNTTHTQRFGFEREGAASGAYSSFPAGKNYVSSPVNYDWAQRGNGYIRVHRDSYQPILQCEMNIAYGANRYSVTPGISIGTGFAVSFTPTYAVTKIRDKWVRVP